MAEPKERNLVPVVRAGDDAGVPGRRLAPRDRVHTLESANADLTGVGAANWPESCWWEPRPGDRVVPGAGGLLNDLFLPQLRQKQIIQQTSCSWDHSVARSRFPPTRFRPVCCPHPS